MRRAPLTRSAQREHWTSVDLNKQIDVTFDFRSDTPTGEDPDRYSPTLRRYHKMLWSKPLPNGRLFQLDDTGKGAYLHHKSDLGEFPLCSDSVIPTFTRWKSLKHITGRFSEQENEQFRAIGYTMGGMMVFPGNRIQRKNTINGARGFNRKIADRMDTTLECIRRHYLGEASPLGDTLARYEDFFALFVDFTGYVEFFLLQDLISAGLTVKFFTPFQEFNATAVPSDYDTYLLYRGLTIDFVRARNRRIERFADGGRS